MKRPILLRASALWAALLLALTWGGDAFGLHACPHHDVVAAVRGGHMAHAEGSHAGHGQQAPSPEHQCCTCVGSCQAGTIALAPAAAALDIRAAVAPHPDAPVRRAGRALPAPPPYLLPYSTAPPAVA